MTVAVVAIKDLRHAKTRLSTRYSEDQRRDLTLAMAFDVLTALSNVRSLSGLLVVTPAPELMSLAAHLQERLEFARLDTLISLLY